jgi:hypothetical protein
MRVRDEIIESEARDRVIGVPFPAFPRAPMSY